MSIKPNKEGSFGVYHYYQMDEDEADNSCSDSDNPTQPLTYDRLRLKQKDLYKSLAHSFAPFRDYFSTFAHQYLIPSRPIYSDRRPYEEKISLSIPKQMEYLRGAVKSYMSEDFVAGMLRQQSQNHGPVDLCKNRSLLWDGKFYYASGQTLKQAKYEETEQKVKLSLPQKLFQFPEPILEISTSYHQQSVLAVRCRYWLYLLNLAKPQITLNKRFDHEITSICWSQFNECIVVATYSGSSYQIHLWDCKADTLLSSSVIDSRWVVHSCLLLNKREILLGFGNKICIFDWKRQRTEDVKRVQDINNDRFIGLCAGPSPELLTLSRRKCIDIIDLRKEGQTAMSFRHMCEQSPPSCLQIVHFGEPLIIAHSPYPFGSSLLLRLSDKDISSTVNPIYGPTPRNPEVLFDSGKLFYPLHPHSISPIVIGDTLKLFHTDNSEGIFLEQMKWGPEMKQLTRIRLSGQNQQPSDPVRNWLRDKILEPYLAAEQSDEESSEQDSDCLLEDNGIIKRKAFYTRRGLQRFYNRIKQLSKVEQRQGQHFEPSLENTYATQENPHDMWKIPSLSHPKLQKKDTINKDNLREVEDSWVIE